MTKISKGAALTGVLLLILSVKAHGAPLTFNSALPVARGEYIVRELLTIRQMSDSFAGVERKATSWSLTTVLAYGVTPDFALFGLVQFVGNDLRLKENGVVTERDSSGIGDARLFGRYTIFRRDWIGRTLRVAPFLGVELPTGADDKTDELGRLPPRVQLGSGSWDPFGGIVISYQTLDFEIDAQVSYMANTAAHGLEFGDVMRFDTSIQYRIWPRELTSQSRAFLYTILEFGLVHTEPDRLDGLSNPDSGGTSLFFIPGLQYVAQRWVLEAGIQIPLTQDLGGTALAQDVVIRGGVRFNF